MSGSGGRLVVAHMLRGAGSFNGAPGPHGYPGRALRPVLTAGRQR